MAKSPVSPSGRSGRSHQMRGRGQDQQEASAPPGLPGPGWPFWWAPFGDCVAAAVGTVLALSGGPVLCRGSGEDGPRRVDDAFQEPDLDGALDRLAA